MHRRRQTALLLLSSWIVPSAPFAATAPSHTSTRLYGSLSEAVGSFLGSSPSLLVSDESSFTDTIPSLPTETKAATGFAWQPTAPTGAKVPTLGDYAQDYAQFLYQQSKASALPTQHLPPFPADQLGAALSSAFQVIQARDDFTLERLTNALQIETLGGWYIGAVTLVTMTAVGTNFSPMTNKILTKPVVAVVATPETSDVNESTPTTAEEVEAESTTTSADASLQQAVQELQKAVTALQAEQEKQVQENAQLSQDLQQKDAQMESMTVETQQLQSQIAQLQSENDVLTEQLSHSTPVAVAVEPETVVEPAKVEPVTEPAVEPVMVEEEDDDDDLLVLEEEEVAPAAPAPKAKKAPAKKKAPKKKATADPDDWSTMAPSKLKRKTVADMTAYLEARGVTTTNSDGKPLKKAELVEAIVNA